MIRPDVKSRIILLKGYLSRLDQLSKYSEDEYVKDFILQGSIERYLHLSIESITDIAAHLLRKLNLPNPSSRADIFSILCNNSILSQDLEQKLVEMVKFRNLLVHGYARLDNTQVWTILQHDRLFIKKIMKTLLEHLERIE